MSQSRRDFLCKRSVPLIGAALAAGPFQANAIAATKGGKSVVIPTHEHAGDLDERLDFPATWDVNVMKMAGHNAPVLTPAQLVEQMNQPVGNKTLRELAEGKKRVVITFDDMTRTTPTYVMTPWVTAELRAAGVKDE